ncbi:hypothetical protein F511_14725 [Dorcoceras hygrometricum]|uniref:Uncharacterized protein n=1 Tax=Dorcoceras hygrometricum TaxID=472368 RepID=A0A2Z7B017_9LAMI|nr:hypothetical protein F511_14725 [Dorcoceras hygrometricum]
MLMFLACQIWYTVATTTEYLNLAGVQVPPYFVLKALNNHELIAFLYPCQATLELCTNLFKQFTFEEYVCADMLSSVYDGVPVLLLASVSCYQGFSAGRGYRPDGGTPGGG